MSMTANKRAVLVVCDSLRADLINAGNTPALHGLRGTSAHFTRHASVFPSTTRTASASLATGCLPRSHGLLGNVVAVDEGQGLAPLNTGKADFRERMRKAMGRVLERPTLAELLAPHGGALIYSNASPGAAHVQDPDGHGTLLNRAGSHGPGLQPLPPERHLDTPKGVEGDAQTTERFVAEALHGSDCPLAVLWLSEPDHTGHAHPLGGPEHLRAIAGADACVARVWEAVQALRARGQDVLFIVTSDHGQETTGEVIDVDAELIAAGLKAGPGSSDVVAASQGSSVLFFVGPEGAGREEALRDFVTGRDWCGEAFFDGQMEAVGLAARWSLIGAASMRKSDAPNAHGVVGFTDIAYEEGGINNPGRGQHGGTGRWEQGAFLFINGEGFQPGDRGEGTSPIDVAPSILRHLGLPAGERAGQDGRPLQQYYY